MKKTEALKSKQTKEQGFLSKPLYTSSFKKRVYVIFTPAETATIKQSFILSVFHFFKRDKNFRHVAIAVRRSSHWALLDPLIQGLDVLPISGGQRLVSLLQAYGCHVCELSINNTNSNKSYEIFPFCVNIVKSVLGIKSLRVVTPRQLFNFLENKGYIKNYFPPLKQTQ